MRSRDRGCPPPLPPQRGWPWPAPSVRKGHAQQRPLLQGCAKLATQNNVALNLERHRRNSFIPLDLAVSHCRGAGHPGSATPEIASGVPRGCSCGLGRHPQSARRSYPAVIHRHIEAAIASTSCPLKQLPGARDSSATWCPLSSVEA